MSFTGTSIDLARLPGTWFAVTAPAPVLPIGQALVVEMGGEPVVVAEADRAAYGEAIDTAVTFSAAIVDQASGLLDGIGVARPGAVLAPLVRSAVENALARHDTGPLLDGAGLAGGYDRRGRCRSAAGRWRVTEGAAGTLIVPTIAELRGGSWPNGVRPGHPSPRADHGRAARGASRPRRAARASSPMSSSSRSS